jgi:5-formyltetrahydrofolate cyclo-ligase
MTASRSALRQQLRRARRALSPAQQKAAAQGLLRQLRHALPLLRGRHIALYLPNDGEIDPRPLARWLERCGKQCYLPRLYADGSHRVWFMRYRSGDALQDNRYGIPEPLMGVVQLPAWALQVVLVPLVGFDRAGHRLGMGGGFYDRTFAFKRQRKNSKPLLIGLAHSLQEVPSLSNENWDIPLDMIATEKNIFLIQK